MTISYTQSKQLQTVPNYAILCSSHTREELRDADHDRREILECRGYRQVAWQVREHRKATLPRRRFAGRQNWWTLVHHTDRLAEIHRGKAQQEQEIVLTKALNVKSLQSESFADRSESRPRKPMQAFQLVRISIVLIVQRFVVICNDLTRFAMEQGGKCVVL